jgi:aconitate hydratase
MGILPLEYTGGADRSTYALTGEEIFDITGIGGDLQHRSEVKVTATDPQSGRSVSFQARVRIDTPDEAEYYRNGGILQYVLRQLRSREQATPA